MDVSSLDWVRLSFVDVFGVPNSIQVPAHRFSATVANGEPFDGSAVEGRARVIETDMLLRPDPSTLVEVEEGIGRAVCTVQTRDGAPWPGDPRTALIMVLDDIDELARAYTVAAELEFYLLDDTRAPIDRGGYYNEFEGLGTEIVREAADQLAACNVSIDAVHLEAGPGQYELDLAPLPALQAADAIVLAKQIVRQVASAYGVKPTFMARPFSNEAGSGLHMHQRISDGAFSSDGALTPEGRSFVAGQLAHARALSALAAPTVNSYKRLHSGPEAPSASVWAHVNRGALIRVSSYRGADASIEFRGSDPSANPYILLAGLLVCGADGIQNKTDLPEPMEEDIRSFDPAGDSVVFKPVPRDLDEALDALLADDVLVDGFDRALLGRLVDGRRADAQAYRSQVSSWEFDRYVDEG
ncbi:MAG: glutamine synthetase family protein [Actinomycetota bacterium]